ncbi:MAG TPA: di-heme oxidoredictase family protein, partial [Kofleriaceae bacterium]
TDLLLHDMGDRLTDARPDFLAEGVEWRTPALWGIGLAQLVLPGATFMHDGRARTLGEAILWHGGEAQTAREAFRTASRADRDALIAFLATL